MKKEIMPSLKEVIKARHSAFLEKMGGTVNLFISEDLLKYEMTLAKLKYIAKILKEEHVIDHYSESNISAFDTFFPCSLIMGIEYPSPLVTVLNGANTIHIVDGAIKGDVLSQSIHLSKSFSGEIRKTSFEGALDDDFDWKTFSEQLLDFIHNVVYKRKKMIETLL
jgi:hypothetical protein